MAAKDARFFLKSDVQLKTDVAIHFLLGRNRKKDCIPYVKWQMSKWLGALQFCTNHKRTKLSGVASVRTAFVTTPSELSLTAAFPGWVLGTTSWTFHTCLNVKRTDVRPCIWQSKNSEFLCPGPSSLCVSLSQIFLSLSLIASSWYHSFCL